MTVRLPLHEEPESVLGVLTKHKLAHIPALKVGSSLRDARLAASCDSNKCTSQCCGTGVWADMAEKERILAHAAEIVATMDDDQPTDPAAWFDGEVLHDDDFPSKAAMGTQTAERGCVFLNKQGRCVLQKANLEGRVPVLKPFFCTAFPITIDKGLLQLDIDNVGGTRECCQPTEGGALSVLDAFAFEVEFTVGKEGAAELRALLDRADPA